MSIAQRLQEVMGQVRPEVALPIIVEVTGDSASAAAALQSLGFSIKYKSSVLPLLYGSGNGAVIQAINQQPFVKQVSYDEPTYAL